MSDSNEYDLGYYEGWRNAVTFAIQQFMAGVEGQELINRMATMRNAAHDEYLDSYEGEEDDY